MEAPEISLGVYEAKKLFEMLTELKDSVDSKMVHAKDLKFNGMIPALESVRAHILKLSTELSNEMSKTVIKINI